MASASGNAVPDVPSESRGASSRRDMAGVTYQASIQASEPTVP